MEPAVGPGPGGFGLGGRARLSRRFGHGVMKKMMGYCGISEKEMTSTRNYPYMSSRTLAKLWVGTYWSYYRETNSRSAWARGLYAHPLNSFIDGGLSTPTRSKPGWYPGGGYNVQNDGGVVRRSRRGMSQRRVFRNRGRAFPYLVRLHGNWPKPLCFR